MHTRTYQSQSQPTQHQDAIQTYMHPHKHICTHSHMHTPMTVTTNDLRQNIHTNTQTDRHTHMHPPMAVTANTMPR